MLKKAKILVVEDHSDLLHGIRGILELEDYEVLTAATGAKGLEILRNATCAPDLIVSDIVMPDVDGYDFYKAVRQETRWLNIPFVFLTAKNRKEDVLFGKELGADDYIGKPFDAQELIVTVNSKLRRIREITQMYNDQVSTIKRNILTILNHEFRTPLTYVVAYADMLHRDADELTYDELRTFLGGINTGADRLRRLIENFMLLIELETGEAINTYNWRKRRFNNFGALLGLVAEEGQSTVLEKNICLVVQPVSESLPYIVADVEYLKVGLLRLIDNAIKFTDEPGSQIVLSAHIEDGQVCLSVLDHGRGVPDTEQEVIFDVFYQINRQAYEDQGAGAGLPIVDRIARMHGGYVKVQSEVGVGSCFSIYLPVAD